VGPKAGPEPHNSVIVIVNNQIKKGLLLSPRITKKLKLVNIWQSYKQERDCLIVHFLRLLAACWPGTLSSSDNHALACNFAKYSPIVRNFSLTHSAINLS